VAPAPQIRGSADVLIHGASAGEVKAALAVRSVLSREAPERRVLVSTGTAAGLEAGADARLPRDVPRHLELALDRVRPEALVLIEGEIWPNLLDLAKRRSLPVGVLGARLGRTSAKRHRLVSASARRWFGVPAAWATASSADAERILDLGVPEERVAVTGWLKWPSPHPQDDDPVRASLLAAHGDRGPLFVLGSVHPGEVTMAAEALAGSALDPRDSRWVVLPRHGGRARRRVQRELPVSAILDPRFGVLRGWYSVADAALVGGGATGRSTHDLLEPLAAGLRPLFFGDRRDDVADVLVQQELAVPVEQGVGPALTRAPGAWDQLRADHDGRLEGLRFLASRGVPVFS